MQPQAGAGVGEGGAESRRDTKDSVEQYTTLNERVFDEVMPQDSGWRSRLHKHLTFRSEIFNLVSLDGLFEQPVDLSHLESLDVSENSLENLDCIAKYSASVLSLKVLKARKNGIRDVGILVLPNLQELDLGHNQLERLPAVSGLPRLEVLILSGNRISGSLKALSHLKHLRKLDVSGNRLNLKPSELASDLAEISAAETLVNLRLKDNPFVLTFPEYQAFALIKLPLLRKLDDIATTAEMAKMRKVAKQEVDMSDLSKFDLLVRQRMSQKPRQGVLGDQSKEDVPCPAFAELARLAEEACLSRRAQGRFVRDLSRLCSEVSSVYTQQRAELYDTVLFSVGADEGDEVMIKGFLENVGKLLQKMQADDDRDPMVMLLHALAKLGMVHARELGVKCVKELGRLAQDEPGLEHDVRKMVVEMLLQPLVRRKAVWNQDDSTRLMLKALAVSFSGDYFPDMLSDISEWLSIMYISHAGYTNMSVASLLASAVERNGSAVMALKAEGGKLPQQVVVALDDRSAYAQETQRERYMCNLKILEMTQVANDRGSADKVYYEQRLHHKLMMRLKERFGTMGEELTIDILKQKRKELDRMSVLDLRTCAALLSALTALARRSTGSQNVIREVMEPEPSFLDYVVVAVTATPAASPALLAVALRALREILELYFKPDQSHANLQRLQKLLQELGYIEPLLAYLNPKFNAYPELIRATERHHAVTSKARANQPESGGPGVKRAPTFTELRDPLVHECFVALLGVVSFFTREASGQGLAGKFTQECKVASSAMNDAGRERLLFQLLEVPSPAVKAAVMECIEQVQCEELNEEEVSFLIDMLKVTPHNIAEEETLLEKVILQLEKISRDGSDKGAGFHLRYEHAKRCIEAVMNVLVMNSRRNVQDDVEEAAEKNVLSQACVRFLRSVSASVDMRSVHMRTVPMLESMVTVLRLEDQLGRPDDPDVFVERTWTGRSVQPLLQCLEGAQRLKMTGKVAFRVLARMADVLEGHTDDQPTEGTQQLAAHEKEMWNEKAMAARTQYMNDIELTDHELQLKVFSSNSGPERIVRYLSDLMDVQAPQAQGGLAWNPLESEAFADSVAPDGRGRGADGSREAALQPLEQGTVAEAPSLTFLGGKDQTFSGTKVEETVDLRKHSEWKGSIQGATTILFEARWDALNYGSRIIDFGSGAPRENIIICNQKETNNLMFQIYSGAEQASLVVAECIQVGQMNKYLCTVSASGHMRVLRDGVLVGEKTHGCAPAAFRRSTLFVGRSHWSRDALFCGVIRDLKVWCGKVLDWDTAVPDLADEHEEEGDLQDERLDRRYLMKSLLDWDAGEEPVRRQPLQGVGAVQAAERQQLDSLWRADGSINPAYLVSAALRGLFVMLRTSGHDRLKQATVASVRHKVTVAGLLAAVCACDPLDCCVAAKFLRLMTESLEMPPSQLHEEWEPDGGRPGGRVRAVACYLLKGYAAHLFATSPHLVKRADQKLADRLVVRGHMLVEQIAAFASVVSRTIPSCIVSQERLVQSSFVAACFEQLLPMAVVKPILEFAIRAQAQAHQESHDERRLMELVELALTGLLAHCPAARYEVLEVFSTIMVRSPEIWEGSAFLNSLLGGMQSGGHRVDIEQFLNRFGRDFAEPPMKRAEIYAGEGPREPDEADERMLSLCRVDAFLDGQSLLVQDPSHETACMACMLTNRGLYILDLTVGDYPRAPHIVLFYPYSDMTRLVRAFVPSALYVGWACNPAGSGKLEEEFLTLVCHNEGDRPRMLGSLHALSQPPGGTYKHRVPLQADSAMRAAMQRLQLGSTTRTLVLKRARYDLSLVLLVLTDHALLLFTPVFGNWRPPPDDEALDGDYDEDEDPVSDPAVDASSREAALARGPPPPKRGARRAVQEEDHADAAEITDKRDKARNAEEGVQPGPDAQDAVLLDQCGVGFMLTTGQAYRGLELVPLDKLSWWPEAEGPGVTLNPDVEAVSLRFFNEVAREGWKKELSRRLGAEGTQWSRGWNRRQGGFGKR